MNRFGQAVAALFLATLTVAGAQGASAGPVGIQAAGDPIRMGQVNSAGATETVVRSTVLGDKATLALFNDASPGDADTLRAFAVAGATGAAIQGFAGAGTFSRAPFAGIAIRGTGTAIGVSGRSPVVGVRAEGTAANGIGLDATGRSSGPGVRADGDSFGVSATAEGSAVFGRESCSVPNPNACNGVLGSATLGVGVLGLATNGDRDRSRVERRHGQVQHRGHRGRTHWRRPRHGREPSWHRHQRGH